MTTIGSFNAKPKSWYNQDKNSFKYKILESITSLFGSYQLNLLYWKLYWTSLIGKFFFVYRLNIYIAAKFGSIVLYQKDGMDSCCDIKYLLHITNLYIFYHYNKYRNKRPQLNIFITVALDFFKDSCWSFLVCSGGCFPHFGLVGMCDWIEQQYLNIILSGATFTWRRFKSTWTKIKIITDIISLLAKGSSRWKLLRQSNEIFPFLAHSQNLIHVTLNKITNYSTLESSSA